MNICPKCESDIDYYEKTLEDGTVIHYCLWCGYKEVITPLDEEA